MNFFTSFLSPTLLITATLSLCMETRPGSSRPTFSDELNNNKKLSQGKPTNQDTKVGGRGNGNRYDAGMGGYNGPRFGYGIPGVGSGNGNGNEIIGGGYGTGYGGPNGGTSKGGIVWPTVVCKERGPCYMKKLACPKKCFTSYSRSGKGYGGGGGGGGCTIDCKKKCVAYC